jgi:hypothetical protein
MQKKIPYTETKKMVLDFFVKKNKAKLTVSDIADVLGTGRVMTLKAIGELRSEQKLEWNPDRSFKREWSYRLLGGE